MGNGNSRGALGQHRLISISSHWLSFITISTVNVCYTPCLFCWITQPCFCHLQGLTRAYTHLQCCFFSLEVAFLTLGNTDLLGHGSSRVWLPKKFTCTFLKELEAILGNKQVAYKALKKLCIFPERYSCVQLLSLKYSLFSWMEQFVSYSSLLKYFP